MLFDAAVNHIRHNAERADLSVFCDKAKSLLAETNDEDLFRWAWKKCVQQIVDRELGQARPEPKFGECAELLGDCQVLISALAQANESDVMRTYALQRASNLLHHDLELLQPDQCNLKAVDDALENLKYLAPKARRQLMLACSTSIETDSQLNEAEALLIRGICSGLGYPPATVLPGQPVKLS